MTTTQSNSVQGIKENLERLKKQLSMVHHDINNPLTILSGNTELIRELARALGVESDLNGPLQDMQQALDQLVERVDRLMVIRKILSDISEEIEG